MMNAKPRTVTLQLDAEMAALLDAVMVSHGSLSTPTQVLRSCAEAGLIRLAVACSQSPSASVRDEAKAALKHTHRSRIESACSKLEP